MYCNRCGAQIPDSAEFCSNCGNPVQRLQNMQIPQQPVHGNKNNIIIGAIAAVAIVLVVCVICFTIVMKGNQDIQLAQNQQTSSQTAQDVEPQQQKPSVTEDKTTEAQTKPAETAVTNNYYYYGDQAAHDDDYYTKSVSSGYLWPSDTQYISFSDLRGMSQDTVAAIRNEIYARHGYSFTTSRWQSYFAAKTWYRRDSSCTENTINSRLSSLERANISTIVSYEESKGWR